MNYVSHRVGGICAGIVASVLFIEQPYTIANIADIVLITAASEIGSLLPDMDEPNSYVGKKVKPISKMMKSVAGHRGFFHTPLFGLLFAVALSLAYIIIGKQSVDVIKTISMITLVGLSGVFISGIFDYVTRKKIKFIKLIWAGISIIMIFFAEDYLHFLLLTNFGLSLGYFSHLLMDMLTVGGLPLLYPFSKKKFHLLRLKTNKHEIVAQLLFIIPTVIFLAIFFNQN